VAARSFNNLPAEGFGQDGSSHAFAGVWTTRPMCPESSGRRHQFFGYRSAPRFPGFASWPIHLYHLFNPKDVKTDTKPFATP
jgi:hypothetical protein